MLQTMKRLTMETRCSESKPIQVRTRRLHRDVCFGPASSTFDTLTKLLTIKKEEHFKIVFNGAHKL
jgi:hypothetical protein